MLTGEGSKIKTSEFIQYLPCFLANPETKHIAMLNNQDRDMETKLLSVK